MKFERKQNMIMEIYVNSMNDVIQSFHTRIKAKEENILLIAHFVY